MNNVNVTSREEAFDYFLFFYQMMMTTLCVCVFFFPLLLRSLLLSVSLSAVESQKS